MLDSLRKLDCASRDTRRSYKEVQTATHELVASLQRNPTEVEMAAKLGLDVKRWRVKLLALRHVGLVSASTRNEGDDLPAPDFPTTMENWPDSIWAAQQLRNLLADAAQNLPDRYQQVLRLYYTKEMTMKDIGGILGINESRVSQIHKSALEKMAITFHAIGIFSARAKGHNQ
jgi:RNA polymerase sigma factor for flagellar operon FliA